jgi:hypothetical protein
MYLQKTISATNEAYLRFHIKAPSLTIAATGYVHLAGFHTSSGLICQIRLMHQGGKNYLHLDYYAGSTLGKTSSAHLLADTVYCLELHFKRGAGSGAIHVYLDGVEITDLTCINLNQNSQIGRVMLGSNWPSYPGA